MRRMNSTPTSTAKF